MALQPHSNQPRRKLISGLALCFALAGVLLTTGYVIKPQDVAKKMQLTSIAFKQGQPIPSQYSCDGTNVSPPLAWDGAPKNTGSFLLILDDPDAVPAVWTHWVVFDLPADSGELSENVRKSQFIAG